MTRFLFNLVTTSAIYLGCLLLPYGSVESYSSPYRSIFRFPRRLLRFPRARFRFFASSGAPSSDLTDLTDDNYARILRSNEPVLIDCYAPWCGPCKLIEPIIRSAAEKYTSTSQLSAVTKYDVESKNPNLKMELVLQGVHPSALPSLILFRQGKAIANWSGAITEAELDDFLKENCSEFWEKEGVVPKEKKKGFVNFASSMENDDYMLSG
mmetsp:Transcript_49062/g.59407  ORF Transcript_49062/g.59407 Transcript_49062/m.59407 type:complete len:210 (+) Transcript_49062:163-792(+)|eukprot:CAMPEP_0172503348 /NCGR_PEP_ID=MMETSP1066-20121228/168449_1 /TAXON_ID=671091 /ORGANISM="Coscinodiscus wailesii, Strain CCMP2513" /LENGTH=209 /DNA_ID=CAMNT_0013279053 /DNA_START=153 /DNA_END=782 /DNA_ORIENTATION=-